MEIDGMPITMDDLRKFEGDIDLGFNATGVIRSTMHFEDGHIIFKESMPARYVQEIFDSVARFSAEAKKRKDGTYLQGQIPLPIYKDWRKQWRAGPRQHGVLWRAFLQSKILDRDWSKFLIRR